MDRLPPEVLEYILVFACRDCVTTGAALCAISRRVRAITERIRLVAVAVRTERHIVGLTSVLKATPGRTRHLLIAVRDIPYTLPEDHRAPRLVRRNGRTGLREPVLTTTGALNLARRQLLDAITELLWSAGASLLSLSIHGNTDWLPYRPWEASQRVALDRLTALSIPHDLGILRPLPHLKRLHLFALPSRCPLAPAISSLAPGGSLKRVRVTGAFSIGDIKLLMHQISRAQRPADDRPVHGDGALANIQSIIVDAHLTLSILAGHLRMNTEEQGATDLLSILPSIASYRESQAIWDWDDLVDGGAGAWVIPGQVK